nr:glycosyltransferase family 4 protein [uncultured Desulfobacter sp.]
MTKVLVFGSTFPSAVHPIHGIFVKERVKHVSMTSSIDVRVISPVPYFPPIKAFGRWYSFSQIPKFELFDGLEITRPRYLLLPKIGGRIHSRSMAFFSKPGIEKIRKTFEFDIIDSHFVYPDGVAAAICKKKYNCPLIITGRGEDILSFPNLPVIGDQIRWALQKADALVALSQEICDAMVSNGAPREKITIIPNGVDNQKFTPLARQASRKKLGLPMDKKIILSVGNRLERKGFHLLIKALPGIREQFPDAILVIVGGVARHGQDYTSVIEQAIAQNHLEEHVVLAGAKPSGELVHWYSSADVFALMTSREGSPNVVMEALSCGIPVVATSIGGIPQILNDPALGVLLDRRTVDDAQNGVIEALKTNWDRERIRAFANKNSWFSVAEKVNTVFNSVL